MPSAEILIIGGGPAGLSTAGALKHAGLETTILDGSERIGQSWERRYDRLHLHTVRAHSSLAHYPIPRTYPKYLSKDQYAQYLREYAAHFGLTFVPNTIVTRVRHQGDRWWVETAGGDWDAGVVVLASGPFGRPVCPQWPGMDAYTGQVLHSAGYHSGKAFAGQRVLVIGAGNSGAEIVVDLAEQGAAAAAISIRRAPPLVPRDFLGTPAQVFAILMYPLPPQVGDFVGRSFARIALGDLRRLGLPEPAWRPFSANRTPVIDVGFAEALKAGRVAVRPDVCGFTPSGVVFADGTEEPYDAVVLATGFHTGLDELLELPGLLDARGFPRFASGASTPYPGLYFMGYFDSLRGFLYESNRASQRLAREIKRYLKG